MADQNNELVTIAALGIVGYLLLQQVNTGSAALTAQGTANTSVLGQLLQSLQGASKGSSGGGASPGSTSGGPSGGSAGNGTVSSEGNLFSDLEQAYQTADTDAANSGSLTQDQSDTSADYGDIASIPTADDTSILTVFDPVTNPLSSDTTSTVADSYSDSSLLDTTYDNGYDSAGYDTAADDYSDYSIDTGSDDFGEDGD